MAISWNLARGIFGNSGPPQTVWEKQFDDLNDDLRRIAKTPFEQIDFSDLWYYHHDLAYVDLQPELFSYLFPVCLMDWHETLLRNEGCSHGDSEFHHGVYHGNVFEKMVSSEQRTAIYEFFRESFLVRLDRERGFIYYGSGTPAYAWIYRFNSLGIIMPRIDIMWNAWWAMETPGRAVASVQYISGLMYSDKENPIFGEWTPERGGGGPYLWDNDSHIYSSGWANENVQFLQATLTAQFVKDKLQEAVEALKHEPEYSIARKVQSDLPQRTEVVESRTKLLPIVLSTGNPDPGDEW